MGGRGASFGEYQYQGGNRYGNQYNATEILMFSEMEDKAGIGQDDRDALQLMLSNYDAYREQNPEAIAGRSTLRTWNDDVVSELEAQGVTVDRRQFPTENYDLKMNKNGTIKEETIGDTPIFSAMYQDVQSAKDVTHIEMSRTKQGGASIRYEFDDVAVTKNLSDNTFRVTHEDGTTATFSTLSQAKADAIANGERFVLPF